MNTGLPSSIEHLFLSGNQRSGKTLVHSILCAHPEVSISPGTQVLAKLLYDFPIDRALGPEGSKRIQKTAQKDRKLKAWPVPQERVRELFAHCTDQKPSQLATALMRIFAGAWHPNARHIGNRKGSYCKEGDLVWESFPNARFVFLMRDPRDAVASMLEVQPVHDLESASRMWRLKARRIRELATRRPSKVQIVHYERFVREPEPVCRALCTFLGVEYRDSMLDPSARNRGMRHLTDTTHDEIAGPIVDTMIGAYSRVLDRDATAVVEAICEKEMVNQGYAPTLGRLRKGVDLLRHSALDALDDARFAIQHRARLRKLRG